MDLRAVRFRSVVLFLLAAGLTASTAYGQDDSSAERYDYATANGRVQVQGVAVLNASKLHLKLRCTASEGCAAENVRVDFLEEGGGTIARSSGTVSIPSGQDGVVTLAAPAQIPDAKADYATLLKRSTVEVSGELGDEAPFYRGGSDPQNPPVPLDTSGAEPFPKPYLRIFGIRLRGGEPAVTVRCADHVRGQCSFSLYALSRVFKPGSGGEPPSSAFRLRGSRLRPGVRRVIRLPIFERRKADRQPNREKWRKARVVSVEALGLCDTARARCPAERTAVDPELSQVLCKVFRDGRPSSRKCPREDSGGGRSR